MPEVELTAGTISYEDTGMRDDEQEPLAFERSWERRERT